MATSQDKGFMEQLREMRNTRTQQLRQGSQQAGLLNKQISAITTLNKTMDAVLRAQNVNNTSLRDFNKKQDALIRQNNSVTQGIRNLSSTIDKSIGSLAKSVTSTKASEVKEIKQSKGVVKEDSGSSMMSSLLMKALPFAITGVIGKTMVWDNMDESVKKGLTDSFGNLVKSIFGGIDTSGVKKVVEPITKEFGIVFGALGDTLDGVTKQITKIVKKIEEIDFGSVSKSLQNVSDTVLGIVNNPELKYYIDKGVAAGRVIGNAAQYIPQADTATLSAAVGSGALAYGALKGSQKVATTINQAQPVAQSATSAAVASRLSTATVSRNLTDKEIKVMQKSLESMKKFKLGNGAIALLVGRFAALSELGMVSGGMKFLKALKDYKVGNVLTAALSGVAALVTYFQIEMINEQIDIMVKNGIVSSSDGEWLKGYLQSEEVSSLIGSVVFGTAGFVAGSVAGPIGSVGLGVSGGISGGRVGADIGREGYEFFNPMPETLKTTDYEQRTENILKQQYYNQQQNTEGNKLKNLEASVSRGSRPSASISDTTQSQLTGYLIDFIKRKEGFRARPYGDYKQLSIGYGTKANSPDEVIDEKEAEKRMIEKLTGFQKTVLDYNSKYGYNWNQSQIDALTSFTYNAGEGNLKTLLGDGQRSNDEIAAKMKEYNKAGGKLNEGLVKRRGIEIAMFTGGRGSEPSYDPVDPESRSLTFAENIARRRKEAKEAEKYEEGSETFMGPTLARTETTKPSVLSAFAKQFSVESFTSDFAQKTKELTDVVNSMFAAQTQQAPTIVSDNSNVTNVINNSSGGSGGGPTMNQVVSTHMSNMNWQFNSMSGGVRA
jgi:GH24 family phage-related lysozyme (muramidase)